MSHPTAHLELASRLHSQLSSKSHHCALAKVSRVVISSPRQNVSLPQRWDFSLVKLFQFVFSTLPAHHCCVQNDIAIAASLNLTSNSSFRTRPRLSQSLQMSVNPARYSTSWTKGSVWDTTEVRPQIPASRSHLRFLATYRETSLIVLLSLGGQAGRQKGKCATKRNASNGECNTSSRYNESQKAPRTTCYGSVPAVDRWWR